MNGRFKALLVLLGLGTAACTPTTGPVAVSESDVPVKSTTAITFIGDAKLVRHSSIALDEEAQSAFERFQGGVPAYGAMYVQPNGSGWSWHAEILDAANARRLSKVGCDLLHETSCILYATLEPVGPTKPDALHESQRSIVERALNETIPGNYIIVSKNDLGNVGVSWNEGQLSSGLTNASKACEVDLQKFKKTSTGNADDLRVDRQFRKLGIYDCKEFHAYRKPI